MFITSVILYVQGDIDKATWFIGASILIYMQQLQNYK